MTIRILGPNDPALEALKKSIELHPEIDTELMIIPWEDYRGVLDKSLSAYDFDAVCIPGHIWIPQLVEDGLLMPLESTFAKCDQKVVKNYDAGDIFPMIARECAYSNDGYYPKQYMLPLFTDGHLLFYRSDLIQMAEEISASALEELFEGFVLPEGMKPFAQKAHLSEIFLDFLPYFWDFGGELFLDGKALFNSEAGIQALNYYRKLRRFSPENTQDYGNAEIVNAITSGECASVLSWGGQAAAIYNGLKVGGKAEISAASVKNAWNATWGVSLPANLPDDRRVMVLETLLTLMDLECDTLVTEIAGSPIRQKSYSAEALTKYPWLGSQKRLLENCRTLPTDPAFGKYLGALYAETYLAFVGDKSAAEALQAAESA